MIHRIMNQAVDRMTIALRVLAAVIEGRAADQADVEKLRRLEPSLSGAPLDELASQVIHGID